ncbi:MAG: ferritin family protein [Planctomycetes bacterium]|nr:ferritin family protein [Planctomycetota bacterium]
MGVTFNADEVFEMGIRIEENGEAFYQAGAKIVDDPKAREVLLDLARKEKQHAETFRKLKAELPKDAAQPTVFDPEGVGTAYLKAAADTHVFNMYEAVDEVLQGVKTAREVVRAALGFEKDSIVFFLTMKDVIPAKLGQSQIDRLIREEQMHIRDLAAVLAGLS